MGLKEVLCFYFTLCMIQSAYNNLFILLIMILCQINKSRYCQESGTDEPSENPRMDILYQERPTFFDKLKVKLAIICGRPAPAVKYPSATPTNHSVTNNGGCSTINQSSLLLQNQLQNTGNNDEDIHVHNISSPDEKESQQTPEKRSQGGTECNTVNQSSSTSQLAVDASLQNTGNDHELGTHVQSISASGERESPQPFSSKSSNGHMDLEENDLEEDHPYMEENDLADEHLQDADQTIPKTVIAIQNFEASDIYKANIASLSNEEQNVLPFNSITMENKNTNPSDASTSSNETEIKEDPAEEKMSGITSPIAVQDYQSYTDIDKEDKSSLEYEGAQMSEPEDERDEIEEIESKGREEGKPEKKDHQEMNAEKEQSFTPGKSDQNNSKIKALSTECMDTAVPSVKNIHILPNIKNEDEEDRSLETVSNERTDHAEIVENLAEDPDDACQNQQQIISSELTCSNTISSEELAEDEQDQHLTSGATEEKNGAVCGKTESKSQHGLATGEESDSEANEVSLSSNSSMSRSSSNESISEAEDGVSVTPPLSEDKGNLDEEADIPLGKTANTLSAKDDIPLGKTATRLSEKGSLQRKTDGDIKLQHSQGVVVDQTVYPVTDVHLPPAKENNPVAVPKSEDGPFQIDGKDQNRPPETATQGKSEKKISNNAIDLKEHTSSRKENGGTNVYSPSDTLEERLGSNTDGMDPVAVTYREASLEKPASPEDAVEIKDPKQPTSFEPIQEQQSSGLINASVKNNSEATTTAEQDEGSISSCSKQGDDHTSDNEVPTPELPETRTGINLNPVADKGDNPAQKAKLSKAENRHCETKGHHRIPPTHQTNNLTAPSAESADGTTADHEGEMVSTTTGGTQSQSKNQADDGQTDGHFGNHEPWTQENRHSNMHEVDIEDAEEQLREDNSQKTDKNCS